MITITSLRENTIRGKGALVSTVSIGSTGRDTFCSVEGFRRRFLLATSVDRSRAV